MHLNSVDNEDEKSLGSVIILVEIGIFWVVDVNGGWVGRRVKWVRVEWGRMKRANGLLGWACIGLCVVLRRAIGLHFK